MAGVSSPLSYLDLDRANPTAVILEKTFRDAVEYKKEIDDGFDAIVLTEPTLASKDADAVLNNIASRDEDKNSSSRSTYCCMVRILGDDSPHNFLPDPFDFYLTDDEECQKRYSNLLQMHTMLTLSKISNADRPEKGDIVRLKLAKNQRSFSTKFAKDYNGIKIKKNAAPPELRRKAEKLEENAKKTFKKGKVINAGSKDDPTFKKCKASNYPKLEKRKTTFFKPSLAEKEAAALVAAEGNINLYSAMLAIISKEQPSSMPNYNPSGIQLDNRGTFRGISESDFDYQTCFRDNGGDQRIFAGFSSLENGMKVFAKILKNKGLPASTGDVFEDSSNLADWYFQNWNLALTDTELRQLKNEGFATRNGTKYRRDWKGTRATFEKQLNSYNSYAVADSSGDTGL